MRIQATLSGSHLPNLCDELVASLSLLATSNKALHVTVIFLKTHPTFGL